jgi:hypothetical protein
MLISLTSKKITSKKILDLLLIEQVETIDLSLE